MKKNEQRKPKPRRLNKLVFQLWAVLRLLLPKYQEDLDAQPIPEVQEQQENDPGRGKNRKAAQLAGELTRTLVY